MFCGLNCIGKSNLIDEPVLNDILYNGRHYNISYIISMENPKILPKDLLLNMDYVMICLPDTKLENNIELLCNKYMDKKYSIENFRHIYKNNETITIIDSKKELYYL